MFRSDSSNCRSLLVTMRAWRRIGRRQPVREVVHASVNLALRRLPQRRADPFRDFVLVVADLDLHFPLAGEHTAGCATGSCANACTRDCAQRSAEDKATDTADYSSQETASCAPPLLFPALARGIPT